MKQGKILIIITLILLLIIIYFLKKVQNMKMIAYLKGKKILIYQMDATLDFQLMYSKI